jgi:hypothetical protein
MYIPDCGSNHSHPASTNNAYCLTFICSQRDAFIHLPLMIYHDVQVLLCLAAVLCAVSAGYIAGPAAVVRAPSFDSAIIKSERLGGNFAYSTAESHAYAAISPVVQNVISPVGVTYAASPIAAPALALGAHLYG